jgi:hypothetical protein
MGHQGGGEARHVPVPMLFSSCHMLYLDLHECLIRFECYSLRWRAKKELLVWKWEHFAQKMQISRTLPNQRNTEYVLVGCGTETDYWLPIDILWCSWRSVSSDDYVIAAYDGLRSATRGHSEAIWREKGGSTRLGSAQVLRFGTNDVCLSSLSCSSADYMHTPPKTYSITRGFGESISHL